MIRKDLKADDIPAILSLLEQGFAGRAYSYEPYLWAAINNPKALVLIGEDEGQLWGVMVVVLTLWNDELVGMIHVIYSKKACKQELHLVTDWAKEQGASKVIGLTPRNPKLFERQFGFKCLSHVVGLEV